MELLHWPSQPRFWHILGFGTHAIQYKHFSFMGARSSFKDVSPQWRDKYVAWQCKLYEGPRRRNEKWNIRIRWDKFKLYCFISCSTNKQLISELKKLYPVVEPNLSDSGSADCCLEFLTMAGERSLPEVIAVISFCNIFVIRNFY